MLSIRAFQRLSGLNRAPPLFFLSSSGAQPLEVASVPRSKAEKMLSIRAFQRLSGLPGRLRFSFCLAAGASSSTTSESPARTKSVLLSIPPVVVGAEQAPSAFLTVQLRRLAPLKLRLPPTHASMLVESLQFLRS